MHYITTNQFWLAANIIFDIRAGTSREVFMLVNSAPQATIFTTQEQAAQVFNFVSVRAPNLRWSVEGPTPQRQGWVIRAVQ